MCSGAADRAYNEAKAKARDQGPICAEAIDALSDEVRPIFDEIQTKRDQYDRAVKAGEEPPCPAEEVDFRSSEEMEAAREEQQALMDITNANNGHVVEVYENRKKEVCTMSPSGFRLGYFVFSCSGLTIVFLQIETMEKSLAAKQKKADKINGNIKSASENWRPALEKLVKSIGTRFSEAFDRKRFLRLSSFWRR